MPPIPGLRFNLALSFPVRTPLRQLRSQRVQVPGRGLQNPLSSTSPSVERFTEGTELMGAAEVQLQSDLIR